MAKLFSFLFPREYVVNLSVVTSFHGFFINWQVTWSPYLVAVEAAVEDVVIQENENVVFRHKVSGFSW